jgi:hypothetical protein
MKRSIFLLATAALFTIFSCKKSDTGGHAHIVAYTNHHGVAINFPTVYVKFGTKEKPSDPTNDYDMKLVGVHENHVHIDDLRYGDYYLYAVGFDSSIMLPVKGGVPVKIKWGQRHEETEVNIAVTE